jgi:sphingomyelin phosphodiesterase acid-like 3
MDAPREKMPGVPSSRVFALIALAVALLAPVCARCADQTWLIVSDIHLTPYDTLQRPSPPGSDSNLALFQSTLAEMKRSVPSPAVVLIPGDFLAHNFPRLVGLNDAGSAPSGIGLEVMRIIERGFAQTYPKAQFAIVLGNNDDPCGDYRSPVDGSYLKELVNIWAPLVNRGGAAPAFAASFARGGYYVASLPVHGLRLVALNSVYFSREYLGDCKGRQPEAAPRELAWLRTTLASTPAGSKNVLMMHIPPGYDAFVTETARGVVAWPYYESAPSAGFIDAIAANADRIAFGIAGHEHRFDFRLVPAKLSVPILIFGALSPIYGNNPTFATATLTPAGDVREITFYAFDEAAAKWMPGRSFGNAWKTGAGSIDADALQAVHRGLESTPALRPEWDAQSIAWPAPNANARFLWGNGWIIPWCAQTELGATYDACAKIGDPMAWLRVAAAVIPAIVLAIALVIILRRRRIRL